MKEPVVRQFLEEVVEWAARQPNVLGVALIGSHARNEATESSDIDLVVVAVAPKNLIEQTGWAGRFGTIDRQQIEHYGMLTSLRIWYSGGLEVEFGVADERWCAFPMDRGTRHIVSNGFRIVWERGTMLRALLDKVADK